jgi:hypothetical protein
VDRDLIIIPADWPITIISHPRTSSTFGIREAKVGKFEIIFYIEKTRDWSRLFAKRKFISAPYTSWEETARTFGHWLQDVRNSLKKIEEDEKTPDFWDELKRSKEFVGGQPDANVENTPFSEAEQADISSQMALIKDYIKSAHELTSEQIAHVEQRLDEAEQAGQRLGRKDWLMAFNGSVFSLLLADLITPKSGQHVILMAIHGLGHLFGFGGPPPLLPGGG